MAPGRIFGLGFGLTQREIDARESMTSQNIQSHDHGNVVDEADIKRQKSFAQNWRAYMLAVAAFMGIFTFGYDTGLGGGVTKLPGFIKDYHIVGSSTYIANLSANIVSILQGGSFFGALLSAPLSNYAGRKKAILVGCAIFLMGGILQVAGLKLATLYAGRFFAGFGVGLMSAVCPTYVAELSPAELRGNISGLFQVLVVIGVAFSYWINYGVSFMGPTHAQWRIPVGFQLVPVGIMIVIIPFIKESPRWLVSKGQNARALENLAWVRNRAPSDPLVQMELAEITAAVEEDQAATTGRTFVQEIKARGNPMRFFIAIMIFVCQQWSGQNSINYYAPTIFNSIGITGTKSGLLASGVYGLVKIVATTAFILLGAERAGRKKYLTYGAFLMGLLLFILAAVFYTHPPNPKATSPSGASIGMAVLIYLFVIPYCGSWGPLPWVYCSEIFATRNRAYGLAAASASQWLNNFAVSRATPNMVIAMPNGRIFFFFAALNMGNVIFSLWIPETIKLSLEQMDIVFGATTLAERNAEIAAKARAYHLKGADGGSIGGSVDADAEKHEHEHFGDKA